MKLDKSPGSCYVCKRTARYEHEGNRYCAGNECQLVAAGMWTVEQARADLKRRNKCLHRTPRWKGFRSGEQRS